MKNLFVLVLLGLLIGSGYSQPVMNWRIGFDFDPFGELRYSTMAIDKFGTLYVISGSATGHSIYAINPDGTLKRKFEAYGIWNHSVPVLGPDNSLYINPTMDYEGYFFACNLDGTIRWKVQLQIGEDACTKAAVGNDGTVYFAEKSYGILYSYSPEGKLNWQFFTGGSTRTAPIIGPNGVLYIGFKDAVYAIEDNGLSSWKLDLLAASELSIDGASNLYVGSYDSCLYSIDSNGSLNWKTKLPNIANSVIIAPNGNLYIATSYGILCCCSSEGEIQWEIDTGFTWRINLVLGNDDTLYISGSRSDGAEKFMAFNTSGGKLWELPFSPGYTTQLFPPNKLYFCFCDLYSYTVSSSGLADGIWPTIYHDAGNTSNFSRSITSIKDETRYSDCISDDFNISFSPNPFNAATNISFDLKSDEHVNVNIFNIRGESVHSENLGVMLKGKNNYKWDAVGFPSGLYFIQFKMKDYAVMGKCSLVQ